MSTTRKLDTSMLNLTNQFLIATPKMDASLFERSVIYICQHDPQGAMGIMINHPIEPRLKDILRHLDIQYQPDFVAQDQIVYAGGPVQIEHGFVLHTPIGNWKTSITLTDELAVTTSRDVLEAMSLNHGPQQTMIALGYAGWEANQLEEEILDNVWLTTPANLELIFNTPPKQRWAQAIQLTGVTNPHLLSPHAGHA